MSKTIVICINPFLSHFIPTLTLAKRLRNEGHKVFYLGFADMQNAVKEAGFEFLPIKSCENHHLVELQKKNEYQVLAETYQTLHVEIQQLLLQSGASLALIGISRFLIYLLPALQANVNVVFYSLCAGAPAFNLQRPPITSDYIPTGKRLDWMIYLIKWTGRFIRKGLGVRNIILKSFYPWSSILKKCKALNIKWKFGIDGFFPNFPVMVFGTACIEFNTDSHIYYAGLGVKNGSNLDKHMQLSFFKDTGRPLVYCSLGTMSYRYQNAEAFIQAVIELFTVNPQWNLILSKGKVETSLQVEKLAENIRIVNFVPQLEVLQYADVMITHGGYSTVKECIYYGVPMLVFSCSYDQHGNAARVHYHRIGLKSPLLKRTLRQRIFGRGIRKIPVEKINVLLHRLLEGNCYRQNILQLRDKINYANELDRTIEFLLEKCKSPINPIVHF